MRRDGADPLSSTTPGTPTTTPSTRSGDAPVAATSASRRAATIASSAVSASLLASSTSWRARDRPAEVAHRAAQEPRPEVEARARAPPRGRGRRRRRRSSAVRVVLGLADEPCVDERAKGERDGRLRDPGAPGDLGAGDRRAGADRLEHGALVQIAFSSGGSALLGVRLIVISSGTLTKGLLDRRKIRVDNQSMKSIVASRKGS